MQVTDLVVSSDFNQVPYNVPDNSVQDTLNGTVTGNEKFVAFINESVDAILIDLFGSPFYQLFASFLETLTPWNVAKADYVIDDQVLYNKHVWKCLVNAPAVGAAPVEGTDWTMLEDTIMLQLLYGSFYGEYPAKQYRWQGLNKMLVPYIFSQWLGNTNRDYVSGAVIIRTFANAELASIADKATRAYNDFSNKVGNACELKNSMYGFLLDKFKDYNFDVYSLEFSDVFHPSNISFKQYLINYFTDPGKTNMFDI